MQARPVAQDAIRKPLPTVKAAKCGPLSFSYDPSPSGVDSNLLILLHGLGDTHLPFQSLGRKLASNLPQTAILSLRGGSPVPFLDGQGYGWWDVWDGHGQGEFIR
jgi:predicted esterase